MHQLMADSSSLLSLIDELRCSLEVVEELFVNGALGKALQSLASSPFCPRTIYLCFPSFQKKCSFSISGSVGIQAYYILGDDCS